MCWPRAPKPHAAFDVARAFAGRHVTLAGRVASGECAEDWNPRCAACAADQRQGVVHASRDSAAIRDRDGNEATVLGRDRVLVQQWKELGAEEFAECFACPAEGGELRLVDRVAEEALVRAKSNKPGPRQSFSPAFGAAEAFTLESDGFVEADGAAAARAEGAEGIRLPAAHPDSLAEWRRGSAEPLFFDDGPPVRGGARRGDQRAVVARCRVASCLSTGVTTRRRFRRPHKPRGFGERVVARVRVGRSGRRWHEGSIPEATCE